MLPSNVVSDLVLRLAPQGRTQVRGLPVLEHMTLESFFSTSLSLTLLSFSVSLSTRTAVQTYRRTQRSGRVPPPHAPRRFRHPGSVMYRVVQNTIDRTRRTHPQSRSLYILHVSPSTKSLMLHIAATARTCQKARHGRGEGVAGRERREQSPQS